MCCIHSRVCCICSRDDTNLFNMSSFFFLSAYVCLFLYAFCLSLSVYLCLFVCVCLSLSAPLSLSACPCLSADLCLSAHPVLLYLPVCLSLSVRPSICWYFTRPVYLSFLRSTLYFAYVCTCIWVHALSVSLCIWKPDTSFLFDTLFRTPLTWHNANTNRIALK